MTKTKYNNKITGSSKNNNSNNNEDNDKHIHSIFLTHSIIQVVAIRATSAGISVVTGSASLRTVLAYIVVIDELVFGSTSAQVSLIYHQVVVAPCASICSGAFQTVSHHCTAPAVLIFLVVSTCAYTAIIKWHKVLVYVANLAVLKCSAFQTASCTSKAISIHSKPAILTDTLSTVVIKNPMFIFITCQALSFRSTATTSNWAFNTDISNFGMMFLAHT